MENVLLKKITDAISTIENGYEYTKVDETDVILTFTELLILRRLIKTDDATTLYMSENHKSRSNFHKIIEKG